MSVIPNSNEVDPSYDDYIVALNLNNILSFIERYANKVILSGGLTIANPLKYLFLTPLIIVKDGALYLNLGVTFL